MKNENYEIPVLTKLPDQRSKARCPLGAYIPSEYQAGAWLEHHGCWFVTATRPKVQKSTHYLAQKGPLDIRH
jgi:hypothetical protein